jgi:hypothetical protein
MMCCQCGPSLVLIPGKTAIVNLPLNESALFYLKVKVLRLNVDSTYGVSTASASLF